jgi:hypothetical protein
VTIWSQAAQRQTHPPRVIAWNWSWSMWYEDPQREVIERLPDGVIVMADWERGGKRPWQGRELLVDEYSLGYAGPSGRFLGSARAAQKRGFPVMAKLQLGTTHELATVPNLPLVGFLHGKFAGMREHGVSGFMGCWNFGCGHTLNTHAVRHFVEHPEKDPQVFLTGLASSYFGEMEMGRLLRAWQLFGEAFAAYPFSIRMLYFSPMNEAPAVPLTLRYEDRPLEGSWVKHAIGDRLEDCMGSFTLEEVITSFETMRDRWSEGLADYTAALEAASSAVGDLPRHRAEELSTARMILCHLQAVANIFRFHRWRRDAMKRHGLVAPCALPPDPEALGMIRAQCDIARHALDLVLKDERLGWHQECHLRFCSEKTLPAAIQAMEAVLSKTR